MIGMTYAFRKIKRDPIVSEKKKARVYLVVDVNL